MKLSGGLYGLKPRFQQLLSPVVDPWIMIGLGPTAATVFGIVCSLGAGVALSLSSAHSPVLLIVPVALLLRICCNALDGLIARRLLSSPRPFGEVLNELGDRVSDALILCGLWYAPYTTDWLVVVLIIMTLLTSYVGILNKVAGGLRLYEGLMGKADRMLAISIIAIVMFATGSHVFVDYLVAAMIVAVAITFAQRTYASYRELSV